jgi:hypothetical protein
VDKSENLSTVKEEEEEEEDQPLESAEPAPSHCRAVGASSHVSNLELDICELTQIYCS